MIEKMSRYPSDLTNSQWKIIAPLIPTAKSGDRPRSTSMRDVVDALLYLRDPLIF